MRLDLSSLEKAIQTFERTVGVACSKEKMSPLDHDQKEAIRAGVIQNFEFTYELCWKFIQRWLKENRDFIDAKQPRTRRELFRISAKEGLINDPLLWFEYAEARNLSSHAYSEDKAKIVFNTAIKFLPDAKYLLRQLKQSND